MQIKLVKNIAKLIIFFFKKRKFVSKNVCPIGRPHEKV